ncbi:MAG: xanthine dehydrogenase molybdopterin binding subunit [Bacteroidia bacterium]|nr:xanthine dehydrogenase molybdopterin binding subunit [Bacteroidia bacterium]
MSTQNIPHESGAFHVTGEARYIDDLLVNDRLLHGRVVYSPHAHARILSFDLAAARALPGVHAVLSYQDLPGENQMGPIIHDEPVLAAGKVECVGQAMFIIAADDEMTAIRAEKLIQVGYEVLEPILSIEDAIQKGELIQPARKIERGDIEKGFAGADHILEGTLHTGAQEHWYLETQVCLCLPGEGNEVKVLSSTQHPSETQALVAEVLGISKMEVEVEVRRMGGAFGGKETQANHTAIWAALLCKATGRPVKIRLFRDDDQKITGKRHPFFFEYKIGFDQTGRVTAYDVTQHTSAGIATDLTMAVLERAMMHADNSYFFPNIRIIGNAWKTNVPSNTAFRGFGGPQGMSATENALDRIARFLKMDPFEVRRRNFYGAEDQNITPYGQEVQNNRLYLIEEQILKSSDYLKRKAGVADFNAKSEFYKRGIALTPVKFGISFTSSFLNQAGALVNIYKDGTVLVNHGGTEMGQGLHTKIQQIAAHELGISLGKVKVNATNTSKVPNTSATAASAGTDLNGMAVKNAIEKLKSRLVEVAAAHFNETLGPGSQPDQIRFAQDQIFDESHPERKIEFAKLMPIANFRQVSLSATGFYKTPGVYFDRAKGHGNPYHYFAFGMACSEVEVDTLTGYVKMLRTDILHDVGETINANIDLGQIEGAFIQGLGWVTTEECKWDAKGNLLNHSPDTYKIPNVQDIPRDFRVKLLEGAPNPNTIRRSKAVGEPPFMLAFSNWLAIKDAISAVGNHAFEPAFQLPATNEVILLSLEEIRGKMRGEKVKSL